jgi:hypothetical protein
VPAVGPAVLPVQLNTFLGISDRLPEQLCVLARRSDGS